MSSISTSNKNMTRHHSSPFPTCFRPRATSSLPHAPPPSPPTSSPNLTTSLYQTHLGLFSLTWSRSFLARTLHLHLHTSSATSPSFHLTLKPFAFWSKHGVKKLFLHDRDDPVYVYWDFTQATFGTSTGPEPESGYYIAILSATKDIILFLGDMQKAFRSRIKSQSTQQQQPSSTLVLRREHVCGAQFYTTKTYLGGKTREILIEVNKTIEDDPRLVIRVDNKRVIQVKHLKWKFRGSERFDIDGHRVQLSWDVYNWLFDEDSVQDEGYALFTFRFEAENGNNCGSNKSNGMVMWSQDSCGLSYERKKMKKKLLVKTSSSSSSSLSSASSCGSSSVMEWESFEENELKAPTGFSLLVYAWKN